MISIVIPLYNLARTVGRAVESVRAQSVTEWELIVVDDASTDNGAQIVAAYDDSRIRLIRQPNGGECAARNRGVEAAQCGIVAFLDADDYWDHHHLRNIMDLIEKFPEAVMFASAYFNVGPEGRTRKVRLSGVSDLPESFCTGKYFDIAYASETPVTSSSVAVRKSALISVGGFPPGITAGGDLITWAKLACLGPLAYGKTPTSYYVRRDIRASLRGKALKRPPIPDYIGAELERLAQECSQLSSGIERYLGQWCRMRAMQFLERGEGHACLRELYRAVTADRLTKKDLAMCFLLALPLGFRASLIERRRRNQYVSSLAAHTGIDAILPNPTQGAP